MSKDLVLYTNPMSARPHRAVDARGGRASDYRVEVLGDAVKSPEYLKVNPMGKGPGYPTR